MQSQARACQSLSYTSVLIPLPVHLVVTPPPAGTSTMMRHVASPHSRPAESVSPNSLAAVVRRMKETALANGTNEPTQHNIEVKYQRAFALRCAAGLILPLTIAVTSALHCTKGQNECEWADTGNKDS